MGIIFYCFVFGIAFTINAQNNYPPSGNVVFDTQSPEADLEVKKSVNIGGMWRLYGSIFKTRESFIPYYGNQRNL
tara:strand:+ start:1888 stop:2112 length:225 start_codon:yes stop_codon:yes gene_type:complete